MIFLAKPRLLIVHDSPEIASEISRTAIKHGYQTYCAATASKAHLQLPKFKPHAVIIDWGLGWAPYLGDIKWPSQQHYNLVMRGRTVEEAIRVLQEPEKHGIHGKLAKDIRALYPHKIEISVSGMREAEKMLERFKKLKAVIVSAMPNEDSPAYMDLKQKFGERVALADTFDELLTEKFFNETLPKMIGKK